MFYYNLPRGPQKREQEQLQPGEFRSGGTVKRIGGLEDIQVVGKGRSPNTSRPNARE